MSLAWHEKIMAGCGSFLIGTGVFFGIRSGIVYSIVPILIGILEIIFIKIYRKIDKRTDVIWGTKVLMTGLSDQDGKMSYICPQCGRVEVDRDTLYKNEEGIPYCTQYCRYPVKEFDEAQGEVKEAIYRVCIEFQGGFVDTIYLWNVQISPKQVVHRVTKRLPFYPKSYGQCLEIKLYKKTGMIPGLKKWCYSPIEVKNFTDKALAK
ncbi:MAG: hypothetical protein Q7S53_02500 [bacterium]|nr:hypothetical protein [bacterium]